MQYNQQQQNYAQTAQNQALQNTSNTSSNSQPVQKYISLFSHPLTLSFSQNQNPQFSPPQYQNPQYGRPPIPPQNFQPPQNYQNSPQGYQGPPQGYQAPYQGQYGQQPGMPNLGSDQERKRAVMDAVSRDSSILNYQDKADLAKWGNISGLGTIGVFTTLFLPVALLMMKKTPKETKLRYLRIGMIAQLFTGGIFLYSSYQVSRVVRRIESNYFSGMDLEQIKNFRGNLWNHHTPQMQSVGPVLANMNRPAFGGNQQYYQPQGGNQNFFNGNRQGGALQQTSTQENNKSDQKESS